MELRRYWQIILKRQRTLFLIVGWVVGLVILGSLLYPPIYHFSVDVWIKSRDVKSDVLEFTSSEFANLGMISSDLIMPGQLQLISQQEIIEKAIQRLNLEKSPGIPMPPQNLININRLKIIWSRLGAKVVNLQNTQILRITAYSSNPKQAVELANSIAQNFEDFYHEFYRQEGLRLVQFLKNQIPVVGARLAEAERKLYEFRIVNNTGDISYYREKLLTSLSTLEDGLDTVARSLPEAENQIKQSLEKLKKMPEFKQSMMTYEANPRIDYIRKKMVDLYSDLASTGEQVTPEYLSYKQHQARLEKLKQGLEKEIKVTLAQEQKSRNTNYDNLISSLITAEINLAVYKARQQSYMQQIVAKKQEISELNRREMEQLPLERPVTALQTAQKSLLSKIEMASLIANMPLSNAYIVAWAKEPPGANLIKYKWFPARKILIPLSFLLSLTVGLWVIFLQEYIDDTLENAEHAELLLGKEVLATLPPLTPVQTATVAGAVTNLAWRNGIWQICSLLKSRGLESMLLGCTSPQSGEDKSRVAASLASALAQNNKQVILVDLDFFHPVMAKLWQLPPGPGMWEVMQGIHPLKKCLKLVGPQQLYLLPTGNIADFSQEKWDTGTLQHAIKELQSISPAGIILLHLPAIGNGEGAPFVALADQTLMVIDSPHTPKDVVSRSLLLVERFQGNILGLILTGICRVQSLAILSHPVCQQLKAKWKEYKRK